MSKRFTWFIVLSLFSCLLVFAQEKIKGVEKFTSSKPKAKQVTNSSSGDSSKSAPGKYFNKAATDEYIELYANNTLYIHQRGKGFIGSYKISGDTITFALMNGEYVKAKIRGTSIIDENKRVWVKTDKITNSQAISSSEVITNKAEAQTDKRGVRIQSTQSINQLPTATKRFALIIGVDEYQDKQINSLLGASNDAKALSDALVQYAGFPREQVIRLASDQPIDRQPTRSNIMRQLLNLRQAAPKDGLLLISFSGHGFERDGRAYLLPMDAQASEDIALLEESAINVETLRERIRQTGVGQVVIILDACRNNPASGRGNTSTPLTDAYIRGFNFDVRNREVIAFATLYSTGIGQLAYEDKDRKQGYFTLAMVEGLRGSAANERGEVTLAGLVDFVQKTVPKRTAIGVGNQQKPFAVIDGYKANDLVISVGKPATLIKPNSQTEQPAAISVKPVPDNPIVKADDEPDVELIEVGKSKRGSIAQGQYKDYKFNGIANNAVLISLQKDRNMGCYIEVYDAKGKMLERVYTGIDPPYKEMPFTPSSNSWYILRVKGTSNYGSYVIRLSSLR